MRRKMILTLCLCVAMMALMGLEMSAQYDGFVMPIMHEYWVTDAGEVMRGRFASDLAARHATCKALPMLKLLGQQEMTFTNGFFLFGAMYDTDEHVIDLYQRSDGNVTPEQWDDPIASMEVRGGVAVSSRDKNVRFTMERYGAYTMLVGRNRSRQPVCAYYNVTNEESNNGQWTLLAQQLLAGVYDTPDGEHVVFGPRMEHYVGTDYLHRDPGVFNSYRASEGFTSLDILYGQGRPSQGDPSSPNYNKMPGGGGAGALMGPMMWRVRPTTEGLHIAVLDDQPFVDHSPRVADNGMVTFNQSPYEGIAGRWPITSVVPLTHQLLRLFPKEVLTLMRGEIYARHGDTFRDPATQRYFNAQPWYKPAGRSVSLTDIERFNYGLIKQVEQSK